MPATLDAPPKIDFTADKPISFVPDSLISPPHEEEGQAPGTPVPQSRISFTPDKTEGLPQFISPIPLAPTVPGEKSIYEEETVLDKPLAKLGDFLIKPPGTAKTQLEEGVNETLRGAINSLTTPKNLAYILGSMGIASTGATAKALVSALWTGVMGKQAVENAPKIYQDLGTEMGKPPEQRDKKKIGSLLTQAGIDAAFVAAPAVSLARETGIGAKPAIEAQIQQSIKAAEPIMPLTAKAVEALPSPHLAEFESKMGRPAKPEERAAIESGQIDLSQIEPVKPQPEKGPEDASAKQGPATVHGDLGVEPKEKQGKVPEHEQITPGVSSGVGGRGGEPLRLVQKARQISSALRQGNVDDLQHILSSSEMGPEDVGRVVALLPEKEQAALQGIGSDSLRGLGIRAASEKAVAVFTGKETAGDIANQIPGNKNAPVSGLQERMPEESGAAQVKTAPQTKTSEQERKIEHASPISKTTTFYGHLRSFSREGEREVPAAESKPGVQPQAERRLPEASQPEAPAKQDVAPAAQEKPEAKDAKGAELPPIGSVIEFQSGFPPNTVRGTVVSHAKNPVKGGEPLVPIVQTKGGTEWPASEWFESGKIVTPSRAEPERPTAPDGAQKPPDPNWQVTVQTEQTMPDGKTKVPGYVQIDDVSGGENKWSSNPEKLREEGYDIPDLSKLSPGQYTLAEAMKKVATKPVDAPPEQAVAPTADKVQEEVTKVAREEGKRSASDIKQELIDELQQRLMKAPREAKEGDKVTIEIPGDGTFTVPNHVEAIQNLLDRAKKIKTDPGKPTGVSKAAIKSSEKVLAKQRSYEPDPEGAGLSEPEDTKSLEGEPPPTAESEPAPPEQKYRIGVSPQTFSLVERLPQSEVEKSTGEQPVRVRNDKTGKEETVLESQLKPVRTLTEAEREASKPMSSKELDEELRKAGMDPSVFPDASSKREALKREKAKLAGPGSPFKGQGPDVTPAIQQLTDQLKADQAVGEKEALSARQKMADAWAEGKSLTDRMVARMRAISESIKQAARGVRDVTDADRRIGHLDWLLQQSTGMSIQAKRAIRQQMKNQTTRNAVAIWIDAGGDTAAIKDALAQLRANPALLQKTKPRTIRAMEEAANLSTEAKQFAQSLRQFFGLREQDAVQHEIFDEGLENYFTHVWEKEENMPDSVRAAITNGKVSTYFQYARERKIPTILEGILQGKTPKLDPADVIPFYNYTLDRAIASRKFIQEFSDLEGVDGRPALLPTGTASPIGPKEASEGLLINPKGMPKLKSEGGQNVGQMDYRVVDHPALKKWKWAGTDENGNPIFFRSDLAVHPEFYERLARFMDRGRLTPTKIGKAALRISTEVKGFKLGLLSLFHQVHVGSHALWHWTDPTSPFRKEGEIDWDHPDTQYAVEKGHLKLAPDANELAMFSEGILGPGLVHKIPGIGPYSKAYSEWFFGEYIPRLKLQTFNNAYKRNLDWYKGRIEKGLETPETVAARVGDAVNNAYGELNHLFLGKYGRSPGFQRLLRGIFLAPDFGEARLRFAGKAFTKMGHEERLALGTMFLTLYGAARVANWLSSGDPQWELKNAFRVKIGKEWWSMRSVIGDMTRLVTEPGRYIYARLNPVYSRTVGDLIYGRDVFTGRKLTGTEKVLTRPLEQLVPIQFQGMLGGSDQKLWESFITSMGVSAREDRPDRDIRDLARKWMKSNTDPKLKEEAERREQELFAPSPYEPLRHALHDGNLDKAWEQYQKIRKTHTHADILRSLQDRPFTGSNKSELKFKKSLTDAEKKVYDAAKEDRAKTRENFHKMLREKVTQ